MHVHIPKTWQQKLTRAVDYFKRGANRFTGIKHTRNFPLVHQHRLLGYPPAHHINDRHVGNRKIHDFVVF